MQTSADLQFDHFLTALRRSRARARIREALAQSAPVSSSWNPLTSVRNPASLYYNGAVSRLSRSSHEDALARLMSIQGIGSTTAEALLYAFGDIEAIAVATHEQLLAVEGIGGKRVDSIGLALNSARYA